MTQYDLDWLVWPGAPRPACGRSLANDHYRADARANALRWPQ